MYTDTHLCTCLRLSAILSSIVGRDFGMTYMVRDVILHTHTQVYANTFRLQVPIANIHGRVMIQGAGGLNRCLQDSTTIEDKMPYKLYQRDCIELRDIVAALPGKIRLAYMDPPYSCKSEDKYYGVGETFNDYLKYIEARLVSLNKVLDPFGSNVLIHLDQKAVHYVKVIADGIFGRDNFQNEIAWCYSSPSVAKSHLPRKHDTILWYGMGAYPFNQPHIPYAGKLKVGGKGAWNPDANEADYIEKGKKLEDFWTDIPSLCRNEPEKVGYPTQKPRKLMDRIVETWSNEGDLVMDPYCGSGSFIHSAFELGRHAIGVDMSPEALKLIDLRILGPDTPEKREAGMKALVGLMQTEPAVAAAMDLLGKV